MIIVKKADQSSYHYNKRLQISYFYIIYLITRQLLNIIYIVLYWSDYYISTIIFITSHNTDFIPLIYYRSNMKYINTSILDFERYIICLDNMFSLEIIWTKLRIDGKVYNEFFFKNKWVWKDLRIW